MTTQTTLSAWDHRLLEKHLAFYQSLHSGTRHPTTRAQRHFVEVMQEQAAPKTQHEIAYLKFLSLESTRASCEPGDEVRLPRSFRPSEVAPDDRVLSVVGAVESATLEDVSSFTRSALKRITGAYRDGLTKARSIGSDAALWTTTLLSAPDLTQSIERWTGEAFGGLTDIYTRALDGHYLEGLKSGADYVSPSLHRLFEGHSLPDSWVAVRDALPSDTFTEEVQGWLRALGSDVVTPAGLPVATLSVDQLEALQGLASTFHIPQ